MSDDSTVVLTDIKAALATAEKEAEQKPAALLVVGGDLNGTLFDLNLPEISCGRNADNTIPLELNGISRYHFKLVRNYWKDRKNFRTPKYRLLFRYQNARH